MAVRVKLRVRSGVNEIVSPALVNSGYESDVPELLLPEQVAEALGLYPGVKEAVVERYRVAGGSEIRLLRLKGAGEVEVVAEGRSSSSVTCDMVVSEGEDELIISDKLASRLGIVIIDPAEGIWCFRDELGKVERKG